MVEMLNEAPPIFVMVTDWAVEVVATSCGPKVTVVELKEICGPAPPNPVPERLTVSTAAEELGEVVVRAADPLIAPV